MFGMQLPGFMLKQMYQKGSLENLAGGFRFAVQNPLMRATIVEVKEVSVGGVTCDLSSVEFAQAGFVRAGASVSESEPVEFDKGDVVAIQVTGTPLDPGEHAIVLKVKTEEFGTLKIEVADAVRPQA